MITQYSRCPRHVDGPRSRLAAPTALAANRARAPRGAFSTIFSAFGDTALYTLAPDGGFEAGGRGLDRSAPARRSRGRARRSSSTASWAPLARAGLGATATTPPICVERGFPSFRFVARSLVAAKGSLRVDVIYGADRKSRPAGTISPAAGWAPHQSSSWPKASSRSRHGESGDVKLQFTASGGTVRMDDVYVDPRLRR